MSGSVIMHASQGQCRILTKPAAILCKPCRPCVACGCTWSAPLSTNSSAGRPLYAKARSTAQHAAHLECGEGRVTAEHQQLGRLARHHLLTPTQWGSSMISDYKMLCLVFVRRIRQVQTSHKSAHAPPCSCQDTQRLAERRLLQRCLLADQAGVGHVCTRAPPRHGPPSARLTWLAGLQRCKPGVD